MSARARTAARLFISAVAALLAVLAVAPMANAAPTPTPTPSPSKKGDACDLLTGPAYEWCSRDDGDKAPKTGGGGSLTDPSTVMDPMGSLADSIGQAAAWVVDQLSNAVTVTTSVDFTDGNFLKTYSLVFAASAFLVLLIWLWAVVKRAVRGVPLTTALGEAIGLLWVTVIASAFTPLILYTVVSAVDGITLAIAGDGSTEFFSTFADALRKEDTAGDGGPFARICLALVAMLAAGVVWLELVIRAALLYVGAVLGLVVYSGLVDKELWGRVRKWAGMMGAIILVKPIIVIVLRLASALAGGGPKDTTAAIISGLAIIVIAIYASAMLFRMIPGMGDEIVAARRDSYDPASRQASAVVTRPVTGITQGINTHGARDSASRAPAAASSSSSSSSVAHASSGIAAHSTRPTRPDVPSQDNRSSGAKGG